MATFSADERRQLAKRGQAMSDGSFPIRNGDDLDNAIHDYGRANNKPAAKAWIKKRAGELGLSKKIPLNWL